MDLIQKLFDAFYTWFKDFGTGKEWAAISLDGLWGTLLQGIAGVFAKN